MEKNKMKNFLIFLSTNAILHKRKAQSYQQSRQLKIMLYLWDDGNFGIQKYESFPHFLLINNRVSIY